MRILIGNESKQSLGGGWTFLRNFEKYADRMNDVVFVDSMDDADIYFISGATMVKRESVLEAKAKGLKIVLRVDNIPKNSRNRNTGTSRLYDFAQLADLVIYQSDWAKRYITPFIKKSGPVIMNGADHEIFNTTGSKQIKEGHRQYLFAQYNRDETKCWHEAWYDYIQASRDHAAHLWIVGNFSPEQVQYNFDFFMGEKFRYVGVLDNPADFAEYLRSTDELLIPYYNDACSNTLIEARLCGVRNIRCNITGGNNQIMDTPTDLLTAKFMTQEYLEAMRELL